MDLTSGQQMPKPFLLSNEQVCCDKAIKCRVILTLRGFIQSMATVNTHSLSHFIHLMVEEVEVGVKVLVAECALTYQLVRHLAFQVHHQFEHFVVGFPWEHDLASVEFIDGDTGGPQVYTMVIAHAQHCKTPGA